MSKYKIFISYSHSDTDKTWVREFARVLESKGIAVWLDVERLRAGESLPKGIESGLRSSETIVTLITPENVKRPNLLFEIGAAMGMGKQVIPIISGGLDGSQVPYALRDRMFIVQKSPRETAEVVAVELARAKDPSIDLRRKAKEPRKPAIKAIINTPRRRTISKKPLAKAHS